MIEYAPGAGIGRHRDKSAFKDVLAFSFLAPCNLRFRRKCGDGKWDRAAITAEPRSLYLLRDDARTNGTTALRR
jgi:alkylated DNA repair dioxygenase AlkB